VTLVVLQQPDGPPVREAIPVAPPSVVVATTPAERNGPLTTTVALKEDTAGDVQFQQLDRESAQELGRYLMDYSSYRSAQGMGGLGYARYAANATESAAGDGRR
jgi:hypothetical protein